MKIRITDNETIGEVKKKFSDEFPFLKLEFFLHNNRNVIFDAAHRVTDETKSIKSLRGDHRSGEIIITGEAKVSLLEKIFAQKFDLAVQVFRRSGKQWLLTTSTDDLTLKKQNEIGKEMMESVPVAEPEDIHEQE